MPLLKARINGKNKIGVVKKVTINEISNLHIENIILFKKCQFVFHIRQSNFCNSLLDTQQRWVADRNYGRFPIHQRGV